MREMMEEDSDLLAGRSAVAMGREDVDRIRWIPFSPSCSMIGSDLTVLGLRQIVTFPTKFDGCCRLDDGSIISYSIPSLADRVAFEKIEPSGETPFRWESLPYAAEARRGRDGRTVRVVR